MTTTVLKSRISWTCKNTWKKASYNTSWCLLGCAIGDLGTIAFFSIYWHSMAAIIDFLTSDYKWFNHIYYFRNYYIMSTNVFR